MLFFGREHGFNAVANRTRKKKQEKREKRYMQTKMITFTLTVYRNCGLAWALGLAQFSNFDNLCTA